MGAKTWIHPRVVAALLLAEFVCLVVLLGLFGNAYPDKYRTQLYLVGVDRGFITGPARNERDKPFIWQPISTRACLFLTVASFALLLGQAALWLYLRLLPPLLAAAPRGMCILAWITVTVIFQIGTATSPSGGSSSAAAWYVSHGCSPAASGGAVALEGCRQALGALGVSLVLVALYVAVMVYAVMAVVSHDNRAHFRYGYHRDGSDAEKFQGQTSRVGGVGLPRQQRRQQQYQHDDRLAGEEGKEVDPYSDRDSMWG